MKPRFLALAAALLTSTPSAASPKFLPGDPVLVDADDLPVPEPPERALSKA